ncbi:hypothetical protein HYX03_04180 [Candidatus Woesearchaeota archaeon]|nr:hypothetical protein [Candidatus Woesearchaeota archaeon]
MGTDLGTERETLQGIRLYSEKEFEGLTQYQQEKHREYVVRQILDNSKEGITVPTIKRLVPYLGNEKTIRTYLEKYVNTNLGYSKAFGRVTVYYPNGRLLHEILEENVPIGKKVYSFIYMKNPEGEFIAIQEKKRNELNALTLSGGIIINKEAFSSFVEHINNIGKKINGGK